MRVAFTSDLHIDITAHNRELLPSSTVGAEAVRCLTPSAEQLRKRFGIADSGSDLPDIVVVGRNLKLSVKYGSDRLACSIVIEPVDIANPYRVNSGAGDRLVA